MKRKILITLTVISVLLVGIIALNSYISKKETGNFFSINNWDNTSHEVTVKLFNEKNEYIFNQSYVSAPNETIINHFPTKLESGMYIEVTLDNNITKTQIVSNDLTDLALYIYIDKRSNDHLVLGVALP